MMRQTKIKPSEEQRGRRSATLDQLEQLKQFTRVVADTSDFQNLAEFAPEDATTNPSLVLKAAQMPGYAHLVDKAVHDMRGGADPDSLRLAMENLLVLFGAEILKLVSGRVSTETDASLSFDTQGLVDQAHRFVEAYRRHGIGRERVLVKLASTWEGIRAGEILEREGIHCNMTLLFCLPQAAACADAGAKLISPFVGRILDWHKKKTGNEYAPADDPGVLSVREIYCYYKKHGYPTEVMGASFRSREEVLELAGCDLLTISPDLLAELKEHHEPVERKLSVETACRTKLEKLTLDEKSFRWRLNEDEMATDLLAKGIRSFHADAMKLKKLLEKQRTSGKAFAA